MASLASAKVGEHSVVRGSVGSDRGTRHIIYTLGMVGNPDAANGRVAHKEKYIRATPPCASWPWLAHSVRGVEGSEEGHAAVRQRREPFPSRPRTNLSG